ncbi:hypothetical protein WA026_009355 [Henosepilachna vigintioctopunctata]|uniref:Amino acid transporter transmembrane domain-containing protein n=1 Tax=Henosepilachna vigintioctopunctata TaxID=420089 RepID=A0AAW1TVF6_9CUCU
MEDRNEEGHDTNRNVNFSSTTVLNSNLSNNEKQYDPFVHRNLVHPNTFNGALMHVVKSSLGTGILAIPMAFKYSGLLVGAIGTILVGLLITHTVDLLVRISHKMCIATRVPSLGFSDTAEAVFKQGPKQFKPFATFARLFVDVGLSLSYFFNNAVYTVFMADSIQQIMDHIIGKDEVPRSFLILAITALLILFCQVRPLKFIVPFSVIANITMFLAFSITFCYMFKTIPDVPIEDRSLATGIGGIPKFLVTMIFAMEGIGTILPVENSLKKNEFIGCHGVLTISMSIIVLMFGTIGFFGYYALESAPKPASLTAYPQMNFGH